MFTEIEILYIFILERARPVNTDDIMVYYDKRVGFLLYPW